MYPNDNQPISHPSNYLDQIAPQKQAKNNLLNSKVILFGGIAIIVLLIIIAIGSLSGGIKPAEQLAGRLLSTQGIVTNATSRIKDTQLLTINSELKIYLINTIRDITPLLTKQNININKLSSTVTKAESNATILATLEDARLNAEYDRTYAREMSYQLDTVLTLMQQISKNTSDSQLKNFLNDAYNNLAPTQKQFADFNAANE